MIYGWELQKSRMSLAWMGWMATVNLIGAVMYAARVTISLSYVNVKCSLLIALGSREVVSLSI